MYKMDDNKPYVCSVCNYSSNSKSNANKHIKTKKGCEGAHLIENIVLLECPICKKEFNDQITLKQHENNCISKKTIIVEKYSDIDAVKTWSKDITSIVKNLTEKFEVISIENKELIKRIEKLEGNIKTEKCYKKLGFEELAEDDYNRCFYEKNKIVLIKTYAELCEKTPKQVFSNGLQCRASIVDEKGNEIAVIANETGYKIMLDGDCNTDDKKIVYGKANFIINKIKCKSAALFKVIKTEKCYCEMHFDIESGKPLE